MFDIVDADGSGEVDADKLYETLKNAGVSVMKEGMDAMIAAIDEDNNGNISREEWEKAMKFYFNEKKKQNQPFLEEEDDVENLLHIPEIEMQSTEAYQSEKGLGMQISGHNDDLVTSNDGNNNSN